MNSSNLKQYISLAEEALSSFLGVLLGEEVVVQTAEPERVAVAKAGLEELAYLVVLNPAPPGFAVLLEPSWLPCLSKAMLGEAMTVADEGMDDLVRELAGQGYGSVRTQLAGTDVTLPDVSFEVLTHGDQLAANALPETVWRIAFHSEVGAETLGGVAILPAVASAAPARTAAPAAAPKPAAAARPAPAAPRPAQPMNVAPAQFPDFGGEVIDGAQDNFNLLAEVELEVAVELGRRKLSLADVLRLTTGSVVELDNLVGEPLEVYANGRLIAEGEAVVIGDQFGIRITRLATERQRAKVFL